MHKALASLSSRDVERVLKKFGFRLNRQHGSHQQFVGFIKGTKRRVTVIAGEKDFPREIVRSMIRQSGLSEAEWLEAIR